jgi:hypothetical protein
MSPTRTRTLLALAGALALGAGGATAAAEVVQDEPPFRGPTALTRPAADLKRSIVQFRRDEARRLRNAPIVLGVPRTTLEAIADCESHGDPRAVSSDGTYRGKYQFSYSTWASVGGEGDPARAGELEQDQRAAMLYKRSGSSPWPICG